MLQSWICNASKLAKQADVKARNEDNSDDAVGVKLLEQFVMRVPGLEAAERWYDVAEGMKAVSQPRFLD